MPKRVAPDTQLHYASDRDPGLRRERHGRYFRYIAPDGSPIKDPTILDRIRRLAIPPAYTDVWICASPYGHLQATGRDSRLRKQYRYHEQWRILRDGKKFEHMVEFGAALPRLRRRIARDLARLGLPRAKVLAMVVTLLDATRLRIGNSKYARENRSFGLTTLRDRHARIDRNGAVLQFRGKGGAFNSICVQDPRLARIVRRCQELPGQQLFQYKDKHGQPHPIDSGQINQYLRTVTQLECSAKDFRTWGATVRAIVLLAGMPLPARNKAAAFTRCINEVIRQVAAELRNTPAVCRKSYINPLVFSAWREGLIESALMGRKVVRAGTAERLALRVLRKAHARCESSQPPISSSHEIGL
jgi:DNA topoisomerase I